MLTVEKLTGGYIVSHDHTREIASAEHVAHLIVRFWPDVLERIQALLASQEAEAIAKEASQMPETLPPRSE